MASQEMTSSGQNTALVTGATGGIGRALSKLFARDGYDLVINARHHDELEALAGELAEQYQSSVTVVARDLSEPGAPDAIFDKVQGASVSIDALVNSAGFGLRGPFVEKDPEVELAMMRVNMVALTQLTRLFLGGMLERGRGLVLNVSSTAAFVPGPLQAIYYASKAYVLSFSQAIASELEGTGVRVTALCPGPTDTGFHRRAGQASTWLLYLLPRMDPEAVARAGYRGVRKGRRVVVPSIQDRLIVLLQRFVPRGLLADLVRGLHQRRQDGGWDWLE